MSLAGVTFQAGSLDRRIRLDYPTVTRTATGGEETVWFIGASVWASKTSTSGGRLYSAESKNYDANLTFRIRARSDVVPGWRLVHGDDVFEIIAIEEVGRSQLMDLAVRAINQSPHSALSALLLHDGTPFLLHDGTALLLHREQDAA